MTRAREPDWTMTDARNRPLDDLKRRLRRDHEGAFQYTPPDAHASPTGWREFDAILPGGGLPASGVVHWAGPGLTTCLVHILEHVSPGFLAQRIIPSSTGEPDVALALEHRRLGLLAAPDAESLFRSTHRALQSGAFGLGILLVTDVVDRGIVKGLSLSSSRGQCPLIIHAPHVSGARVRVRGRYDTNGLWVESRKGGFHASTTLPEHGPPLPLDPTLPDRRGRS